MNMILRRQSRRKVHNHIIAACATKLDRNILQTRALQTRGFRDPGNHPGDLFGGLTIRLKVVTAAQIIIVHARGVRLAQIETAKLKHRILFGHLTLRGYEWKQRARAREARCREQKCMTAYVWSDSGAA